MSSDAAEETVAGPRSDDTEVADWIEAMRRHVDEGPPIYRPGAFWGDLLEKNLAMLRADGIRSFKRTVSNNYYNWLVVSWLDPQLRNAVVGWLRRPRLDPLRARMEPVQGVRTMLRDEPFDLPPAAAARYRFFVAQTWERARIEDRLGLTARLEEPEIGSPVRLWSGGRRISQDLANSVIECNYAARSGLVRDGARIAELGAGYGRLAHVFQAAAKVT